MIHKRKGFTLVEIALFLAITGLLFVGIIVGTNNSIFQQRFTDSVQNYAEFLRSIYSEVSNPQSVGNGRSETAIYGKLISFGQTTGLDGEEFSDVRAQKIYVYDVVGEVKGTGAGTAIELLEELKANVVFYNNDGGKIVVEPAGIVESYTPRWGAAIEVAERASSLDNFDNVYKGTILVVRHPGSGTINTLVSSDVLEINAKIKEANEAGDGLAEKEAVVGGLLINKLGTFKVETVNFCVNPNGVDKFSDFRRNVRLVANARNASGVEIIDMDSDKNACKASS